MLAGWDDPECDELRPMGMTGPQRGLGWLSGKLGIWAFIESL